MALSAKELMGAGMPGLLARTLETADAAQTTATTAAITATGVVTTAPVRTTTAGIVAAGTVIGDGTALTSFNNIVATTAASTGVNLPDAPIGSRILIQNDGANTLNVWPPSGTGTLNGGSAGAAITVATTVGIECIRVDATDWLCVRLGAKET